MQRFGTTISEQGQYIGKTILCILLSSSACISIILYLKNYIWYPPILSIYRYISVEDWHLQPEWLWQDLGSFTARGGLSPTVCRSRCAFWSTVRRALRRWRQDAGPNPWYHFDVGDFQGKTNCELEPHTISHYFPGWAVWCDFHKNNPPMSCDEFNFIDMRQPM